MSGTEESITLALGVYTDSIQLKWIGTTLAVGFPSINELWEAGTSCRLAISRPVCYLTFGAWQAL